MRDIRVAILADDRPGFVKVMAEGLRRIMAAAGAEAHIFSNGLEALRHLPARGSSHHVRAIARRMFKDLPTCVGFTARFARYDALVVVNSLPDAFLRRSFCDETLRSLLPNTPILLYDVFYLPTRGHWWKWLRDGNPDAWIHEGNQWGMTRYDWYLCASVVSEVPMPDGLQPYSHVGLNLDDGTLYPEQNGEFVALLDFERPEHRREREIQIAACEETNTPYIALQGRYSTAAIRQIYRRCSVYFVAFRESFGIPICELQACGSYVFLAHPQWAPSHWLKPDLTVDGPGELPPNFVVYHNDKARLVDELRRIRSAYAADVVVSRFRRYHPQLFYGNVPEMCACLDKIRSGEIHSRSHEGYASMPVTDYRGRFSHQLELIRATADAAPAATHAIDSPRVVN